MMKRKCLGAKVERKIVTVVRKYPWNELTEYMDYFELPVESKEHGIIVRDLIRAQTSAQKTRKGRNFTYKLFPHAVIVWRLD